MKILSKSQVDIRRKRVNYDTYYKEYLRHQIKNNLNEISKQICKENFKLGNVLMMEFGEQELEKEVLLTHYRNQTKTEI